MVDIAIPIILHLATGTEQSLCLATLKRGDGCLYAAPSLIGPAFSQQTEIDEVEFELLPGRGVLPLSPADSRQPRER